MSNHRDVECMAHALRLARRGCFTTRPNPNVGCVITNSEGKIVGTGFHQHAGEAHAEIIALEQAGEQARNGTVYVTLEPCCHQGKTGPCTQALVAADVARVVIAMEDPNPLVSGKGIQQLQQQGIEIESNVLADQAQALNVGFIKRMRRGLPWVRVKSAISLDGQTALSNGKSKWITSTAARDDVQTLRASSDAVLTGIGTVLADDPSLNVRLKPKDLGIEEEALQPLRVVIDSKLQMPTNAKMLGLAGHTLIFANKKASTTKFKNITNCEVMQLDSDSDQVDMEEVMKELANREINTILVEAGSTLVGTLVERDLVDELIVYIAPKLFGSSAKGMVDLEQIKAMDDRVTLEYADVRQVGTDLKITALVKH